jgi:hypothetical protein
LTTAILILHSVTAGRHATQTPHRRHTDATQTPHRRHTDATQTPDQADARQTKQTQGVWFVHLLQTNRQRTGACHTHVVRGIVARGYRNRGYSRSMAVAVQPCNRGRRGTPWHGLQRSAMQRQIQGPLRLLVAQVQCGGAGEVFSGQLAAQTVVACLHKGSTATVLPQLQPVVRTWYVSSLLLTWLAGWGASHSPCLHAACNAAATIPHTVHRHRHTVGVLLVAWAGSC